MARPKKNNADYFSHDVWMRNHRKIIALRKKYGLTWYAIYCMLLEHIWSCDFFIAKWDEVEQEIVAWDFWVSVAEMNEIMSFCGRLNLIQIEWNTIKCESLTERLVDLVVKRERERKRVSVAETTQAVAETTQSKVKESKVKEIKENNPKSPTYDKWQYIQKMRAVETKWKFLVGEWNKITWRNDLMDEKTRTWFSAFIYEVDTEDYKRRVKLFKKCRDLIDDKKLGKYLFQQIQNYTIGKFIEYINIFDGDTTSIFEKITSSEYLPRVRRSINEKQVEFPYTEEEHKKIINSDERSKWPWTLNNETIKEAVTMLRNKLTLSK